MIQSLYRLKDAIDIALTDPTAIPEVYGANQIDWELIRESMNFLEPFNYSTEKLSGENYATISLIGSHLPKLMLHLMKPHSNEALRDGAAALH